MSTDAIALHKPFCFECGKISYPTEQAAQRMLVTGRARANPKVGRLAPQRAYSCPSGHGWHLTSTQSPRRRRRR